MPDFNPSPEQQRILRHNPGSHARVLAGPGTGKSATLVALIDQLLRGDEPPRIKLLTFTRAATGELAKKVSTHPAAAAERPSTIHSFAISVLLRNRGAADLPQPLRIADTWEYQTIVRPTLARRAGVDVRRLDKLVREMSANWSSLRPDEDPAIDPAERTRFNGAWGEHRTIYGYTLLQELPYALRGALRNHPDLQGVDYNMLIVDEYQDLNACDLDVLSLIAERGCTIIGAGDDDQSIYAFRKADPEGIRRFPQDYPGAADYALSVTQRCGARIIGWANHVIQGDPDRPPRTPLVPAPGSEPGEVALLAFANHAAEARGIAQLAQKLIEVEGLPASELLILLRGDYNGTFSAPIKAELDRLHIPYSDPEFVERLLAEPTNRRMLAMMRLLINREDSLAWATLLHLTPRVSDRFSQYVYDRGRADRTTFGAALLAAHQDGCPAAPRAAANVAQRMVADALAWLDAHPVEQERDEQDETDVRWGAWILGITGGDVAPSPTEPLRELLLALDELTEPDATLGRFLGQIAPLGRDRAANESQGIRIMTMISAKGLTVRATILGALEEGILPRPDANLAEERRLLYVGITRARAFVYATWARRRTGPTARAGAPRVRERRTHSHFFSGGPVESQDGDAYIRVRWPTRR